MRLFNFCVVAATLAISTLLAGCTSSGGGDSKVTGCVPVPEGNVAWTYENCGPLHTGDFVQIYNDEVGQVPSGVKAGEYVDEPLGSRSVNKGHVTFTYQYMDWLDLPWPGDDTLLVFFKVQSQSWQEVGSWQIQITRHALDGNIMTRLASQRADGICEGQPARDCKKVDDKFDNPVYIRDNTYKFDCTWDTSIPSLWSGQGPETVDGRVECSIYENGNLINTSWVPTSGPYPQMDSFLVGGRISQIVGKPAAIQYLTMTDVRLTIFND
ncbi:MAG: hypothetical protein OEZ28_12120 [Nitrospinota bacterium]|nr:hypothetical protein [Nitrospinota bacterium]